jgi:hypothetical protein
VPVEEVFDSGVEEDVYNFRVAEYHTYFVGRPEWGFSVWAHNTCIQENAAAGRRRELREARSLQQANPNASVQREIYLRGADGKRLIDPLTGEARRVDIAVIKDGRVVDMVEVTSRTAPKADQIAKEHRIRELADAFIRDTITGELLSINDVDTRLVRRR